MCVRAACGNHAFGWNIILEWNKKNSLKNTEYTTPTDTYHPLPSPMLTVCRRQRNDYGRHTLVIPRRHTTRAARHKTKAWPSMRSRSGLLNRLSVLTPRLVKSPPFRYHPSCSLWCSTTSGDYPFRRERGSSYTDTPFSDTVDDLINEEILSAR